MPTEVREIAAGIDVCCLYYLVVPPQFIQGQKKLKFTVAPLGIIGDAIQRYEII